MQLNDFNVLYLKTLEKWGTQAQYDQAIEECAELIVTLKHLARGKVETDKVIDELADVFLMVGQLSYMLGEQRFENAVALKVAKLEGLIDAAGEKGDR